MDSSGEFGKAMRELRALRGNDSVGVRLAEGRLTERLLEARSDPVKVGRFVVIARIGQGTGGTVFSAYDPELDRKVALKLLAPGVTDQRWNGEARALARLNHPNVVTLYEVGDYEGRAFLALELVEGQSLAEWLDEEPRRPSEVLPIIIAAARGVHAAHEAGLVHGDIKPSNILLGKDGTVRVADFGLSSASSSSGAITADGVDAFVTRSSVRFKGTPAYMAPEQLRGSGATSSSDQFALCTTLYEALFGHRPFADPVEVESLAAAIERGTLVFPSSPRLGARQRAALRRGLAPDPASRHPSIARLIEALRPRSKRRWTTAAGIALASVPVMWLAVQDDQGVVNERLCRGPSHFEGIWDESVREELRATMKGGDFAHPERAFAMVAGDIDRFVEQWEREHHRACADTRVRFEQSPEAMELRMQCLGLAKRRLAGVLDVLSSSSEARSLEVYQGIIGALPKVKVCGDVPSLRRESEALLLMHPDARAMYESSLLELSRALALHASEDFEEARAALARARQASEVLDHPPLRAELLVVEGYIALETAEDLDEAERLLGSALELALQEGQTFHALAASDDLHVLYLHQERLAEARWMARIAASLARQLDAPDALAVAHGALAGVESRADRLPEAIANYRQALTFFQAAGETDDAAATLANLALLLERGGHYDDAKQTYARAEEELIEVYGPEHLLVAQLLANEGVFLLELSEYEESLRVSEESLRIRELRLGDDHVYVAMSAMNIAQAQFELGRLEQARDNFERAVAIFERHVGPSHPWIARSLSAYASLELTTGNLERAETMLRRALEMAPPDPLNPSELAGDISHWLGRTLLEQGRAHEAVEHVEHASRQYEAYFGTEHVKFASVLATQGQIHEALGEFAAARRAFEQALAAAEATPIRDDSAARRARAGLSRLDARGSADG